MKKRTVLAHIGLFAALLALLWLLLSVSAAIPNEALYHNFESSALSYGESDAFQFHNGSRWNAIADNYADSILLNLAWNMGTGASPFLASIDTHYYNGEALGENAGLYLTVTENTPPNTDYTRYWHGGAMFVRVLHLFTDAEGIRNLGFAAVLVLVLLTAAVLGKDGHRDLALLLILSLAAVQIWNIRLCLEYQTAFLVTFLLCPFYLAAQKRGDAFLPFLSTAGGVLIAFFDFLTTETVTILIPLMLVIGVRAKENRLAPWKESLRLILGCCVCWGAAYIASFLVKWTAASLVSGENAFALAVSSASRRITAIAPPERGSMGLLSSLMANLTVVFGGTNRVQTGRALLGSALFLGVLASVYYLFPGKKRQSEAAILLLGLGSLVPLRFLVLNNHSYLHEFFTYRALCACVLALLLALRLNVALPTKKKVRK